MGKWFTRRARLGYLFGVLILAVAFGFGFASQENWITTALAPVMVVVFVAIGYFIVRRHNL